jgi:hypothetical protein
MDCFGYESFLWPRRLTEEPIFDRLMSFFLGGAEAVPLRGVTRSSVRDHFDFPTDRYDGFAVECEWVLHLLVSGTALHVQQPLYSKRILAPEISVSATRRSGLSREQLLEALEDHRVRLLTLVRQAELPNMMRDTVELATEAAVLRRHTTFSMGPFSPVQFVRSEQIIANTSARLDSYGKGILAMTLLARSHHASIEGDSRTALDMATAAVDADPHNLEGLAHLARLQLRDNRSTEALATARRAWTVAPHTRGLRELIDDCETYSERAFLLEKMSNGQPEILAKRFDAARYLVDHPDVAAAGVDPWHHFREFGCSEGRRFRLLPD